MRIKKTNGRGRYRNYPTAPQIKLLHQQVQTLFPGMEDASQVVFAYHLDKLWREIKSLSLVCWNGNSRAWELPITDDLHNYLPEVASQETQARSTRRIVKAKASKVRRAKGG